MTDPAANELLRTPFYDCHVALAAKLVEFGGWDMPVQYPTGAVAEHLATRTSAGLFDVAHMGRFAVRGPGAVAFLQHALTNDAAALAEWSAQYTLLATPTGGAVDDAFLYRRAGDDYLLVVNAANRDKDWAHLQSLPAAGEFELTDVTGEIAMLALQGPASQSILEGLITDGALPKAQRNAAGEAHLAGAPTLITRTGYTGEAVCFELFFPAAQAEIVWNALLNAGATPVGL
ncbi:MAG: aminomethyltransferase family protein, partial [Planctomycetota bacterium]